MAIYTTDSGLKALYRLNNDWTDSAGSNDLTASGSPTFNASDKKEGSHAADFEAGSNQYATISDASQSGLDVDTFSIGGWIKLESLGVYGIISKTDQNTQRAYELGITTSNVWQCLISANGTSTAAYQGSTALDQTGEWYHLVAVYNKTDVRLYLNGELDNTPTARTTTTFNSSVDFALGRRSPGAAANNFFDGLMDEMFVFNRALSATEVIDIYHSGIRDVEATTVDLIRGGGVHSSYSTVQAAVTAGNTAGDIIEIGDDRIYYEAVLANSRTNLTLRPKSGDSPILRGCIKGLVDNPADRWTFDQTLNGFDVYFTPYPYSVSNASCLRDATGQRLFTYNSWDNFVNGASAQHAGEGIYIDETADRCYIILESNADPNGVALRISFADYTVFVNNSDDITFQDLTIESGSSTVIQAENSDGLTVSNCNIRYGQRLIWLKNSGDASSCNDAIIEDCLLEDDYNASWTWEDVKDFGTPQHMQVYGIVQATAGTGGIFRNNEITGVFDGFSIGKASANSLYTDGTLVYGNTLHDIRDDCFEMDFHARNIQIYDNYCYGTYNVLSTSPFAHGPLYFYRNIGICDKTGDGGNYGRFTKRSAGDACDEVFIYHNTLFGEGFGVVVNVSAPAITNFRVYNNILITRSSATVSGSPIYTDTGNDFDGNIYYRIAPSGNLLINYADGSSDYANLAAFVASANGIASGWEASGLEDNPLVDTSTYPYPFTITSDLSPAIGAAVGLPGDWPDMAEYEGDLTIGAIPFEEEGPPDLEPASEPPTPLILELPSILISSYLSGGLALIIEDPLFYSTRRFSDRLTSQVESYSHEIRAIGGYYSASITINDNRRKIEDWIEYGLGRHLTVWNPSLCMVWEGFVSSIEATLGVLRYSIGPLLNIGNRVYIVYSVEDTSVSPPAVGSSVTTSAANNTVSQARFGIVEKKYTKSRASQAVAEQTRDMYASDPTRAFPPTSRRSNLSGEGPPSVTIECLGYWHWLGAYYYSNLAGTGDVNLSTKIQSVLAANPNSGMFSADYAGITTNTTQVAAYEDGSKTPETILKDLNSKGDSSDNPYTMGFYAGRRFVYEVAPTEITYQQRIAGNRGITNKLDARILPWDVTPADYIFYPDFLVGRHPPITAQSLGQDPRSGFIEVVKYTAPWGLEVDGVKLSKLDQYLVRRGFGSGA